MRAARAVLLTSVPSVRPHSRASQIKSGTLGGMGARRAHVRAGTLGGKGKPSDEFLPPRRLTMREPDGGTWLRSLAFSTLQVYTARQVWFSPAAGYADR